MEEAGIVSIWLGRFASARQWKRYLKVKYSKDGDFLGSGFTKSFGIDYFDEDFFEAEFFKKASLEISFLLDGFSYDKKIAGALVKDHKTNLDTPANCVLLIYNFHFPGQPSKASGPDWALEFVTAIGYKP
jgi:hypothetical protein